MTTHTRPAGANTSAGRPLALGSMCTGYGGLDMAVAQALDVEPAWVADPDPGAATILAHHWPDVPNLGDITAVDWTTVPPIDVLCAGYPCQPFSHAGKRKGTADERHIWPHIADALRVLRPRLAIFENVANHLRLGFDTVLADLARLGFDAEWCLASASEVGAAHRRRRLFILAWPADADRVGGDGTSAEHRQDGRPVAARNPAVDPARDRRHQGRPAPTRLIGRPDADLCRDAVAHAARIGHGHAGTSRIGGVAPPALPSAAADADRDRRQVLQRDQSGMGTRDHADRCGPELDWGKYTPAIDRWARILGRPAPAPTEPGRDGRPRLSPRFVEWLMGLPAGWVTAVPGLTRNAQLKALGNGVVWQQGAAALDHLLDRIGAAA